MKRATRLALVLGLREAGLTFKEIGQVLGVTAGRAAALYKQAIAKKQSGKLRSSIVFWETGVLK